MTHATGARYNPLSYILVRPRFIDADTCQRLVQTFDQRPESNLGVGSNDGLPSERPLSTTVCPDDVTSATALLDLLKVPGSLAQRVVLPLVAAYAPVLAKARTVTDVPNDVAFALLAGLTGLVRDPAFLARHRASFDVARHPALHMLVSLLQERGILDADGAPRALTLPGAARAVEWLNVSLLEELVLPGAFKKRSRVFRADLRDLRSLPLGGLPGLPAQADLLEALEAMATLLADPDGIRIALGGVTAGDAQLDHQLGLLRDDPSDARAAYALHLALAALAPDVFFSPGALGGANSGRATIQSVRKMQTVEWSDLRPAIDQHVHRFVREEMVPYYGITCTSIEEAQLLKTNSGGFYRSHNDSFVREPVPGGTSRWRKDAKRDIAIVIYLSRAHDYEGGTLSFPELDVKIVPQQGMAIAFPADHHFYHRVDQVLSGTRWAIASWMDCLEAPPVGAIDPSNAWYAKR